MKRFSLALLLILASAQLWAAEPTPAPPKVEVKATYTVHEPIVATVTGLASLYLWDDTTGFEVIELDGGKTLHVWAKPGKYRLRCRLLVVDWDKKAFTSTRVSADFIVTPLVPEPDPVPPVPPVPPPPPPNQKWQVAFFYERTDSAKLTPGQQEILAGLTFREELKAKGHKIVCFYDKDIRGTNATIPTHLQSWFDAIKNDSLPRVAFAPIEGGPIRDFPLPADKTALDRLLEKGGE